MFATASLVARLGGDELVVLLETVGDECPQTKRLIQSICQKIIDSVKNPIQTSDQLLSVTLGVGVYILS